MKIYKTTLIYREIFSGRPDFYCVHSRKLPDWNLIQQQLSVDFAEVTEKMNELGRKDYQKLGDWRLQLSKWAEKIPKSGQIVENSIVTIREIKVV